MQHLVTSQLDRSLETLTAVRADKVIVDNIVQAGKAIALAMKNGKKLMVAGNGGSAADSQHLVAEFVSRLVRDRSALPAMALTTDTSILTAIGNDFSYDNIFEIISEIAAFYDHAKYVFERKVGLLYMHSDAGWHNDGIIA